MAKFNTILDGKLLTDVFLDESGYNYYGYVAVDGTWAVMREATTEDEYRFQVGKSGYDISTRATGDFKRPDQFNFNTV